jgi:hypothetical protein
MTGSEPQNGLSNISWLLDASISPLPASTVRAEIPNIDIRSLFPLLTRYSVSLILKLSLEPRSSRFHQKRAKKKKKKKKERKR